MTEFTLMIERKDNKLFTDIAEELGFDTKLVTFSDMTTTIKFVYPKEIPPLVLIKLGRLFENKLIFKEEVNIPEYWSTLFSEKQSSIITSKFVV